MLHDTSNRLAGIDGQSEGELIEGGTAGHDADAGDLGKARLRVVSLGAAELGDLPQPLLAKQAEVDRGSQGTEGLVGTDVGGGLGPANMLLAGLQGQHEGFVTMAIDGSAHQATRHAADQFLGGGHEAQIGTAEGEGDTHGLAFAGGNIDAHFARGLEHGEGDGVDRLDDEDAAGMTVLDNVGVVVDDAEEVWILYHHGGGLIIQCVEDVAAIALAMGDGNLLEVDGEVRRVGGEHLAVDGVDAAIHHDPSAVGGVQGHLAGLVERGATVVKRGVGDGQTGQLADGGLVFVDGLQGALRNFGLVGGVGRVELAAGGECGDGGRDEMVVEAAPDEVGEVIVVATGQRLEMGLYF